MRITAEKVEAKVFEDLSLGRDELLANSFVFGVTQRVVLGHLEG